MPRSVEVFEIDDKTVVRIIADDHVSERKFDHADYAWSWAEGQRIRLGLPMPSQPYEEKRTGT